MISYRNATQLGNSAAPGYGLAGSGLSSTAPAELDMVANQPFQASSYSTQDIAYSFHTPNNSQTTQDVQFPSYQHDSISPTFDPPMSFRDRHRFLDGIYNSSPDPDAISVKNFEGISRRAGLSMEEVLSWFEDEKGRRTKLLAGKQSQGQDPGSQFPLSPADTTTPPQNSTVTLCMSQFTSSLPSDGLGKLDDIFSPPEIPPTPRAVVPEKAKRGRPAKNPGDSQKSSAPVAKRQKQSIKYPCPDCKKLYPAERWAEHVKRVHFPDQVWDCQKICQKTGKPCGYGPAFRADNFGTHLRTEHNSDENEIAHLKEVSKFRVVDFFHHVCGFCGEKDTLTTRDESIEHIKDHLKKISLRPQIPSDQGISEWSDRCGKPHTLIRGVHYRFEGDGMIDVDAPGEDDDTGDSGGPNQGSSDHPQDKSQSSSGQGPPSADDNSFTDDSGFYSSQGSNFFEYGHSSTDFEGTNSLKKDSSFGLEGLVLPFTSIRKLGSGGHGSVDEVVSASSMEHFARKSVLRMRITVTRSTRMTHLKNELTILKNLSHPNLVKLIGAYTDEDYSHLIMSPVADQNLADFMGMPNEHLPSLFLGWMSDLSSAMGYLHDKKVKHLDVKPQNILVKGLQILLADFGTAESLFKEQSGDSKSLSVTPMYCAPETIRHGQQDYPADIFSLGCVFSEMLTCHCGKSLQEYEKFRIKDGKRAFHLTLPETSIWIQDILDYQTPDLILRVAHKILHMLGDIPARRPLANELHLFFSATCASTASSDGNRIPNESTSPAEPLHRMAYGKVESGPQETIATSLVPLPRDTSVISQEKDKGNSLESTNIAASLLMQLGQDSYRHLEDQAQGHLRELNLLQHHQYPENNTGYPRRDASDAPDDCDYETQVTDMVNRAYSVALSDNLPSLSSTPSSGRDFGSQFSNFSSSSSSFNISEYSFPTTEFASDEMKDFPLYPDHHLSGFVDPSIIHPSFSYGSPPTVGDLYHKFSTTTAPPYPSSPTLSHFSVGKYTSTYPAYPYQEPVGISSLPSLSSSFSYESWTSDESREKGRCSYPECGKVFKDLKAHILTHQTERPEKCPIQTCDYHTKGFARKYDQNRHTLTHYKGTMVCGFCPGSGSAAEKSFNRADVFKRHLTSMHAVEQILPNNRRKSNLVPKAPKTLAGYAPDATGKCSTCSSTFNNAQDFYEHLDDCVLRIVRQEGPLEAVNAARLADVECDAELHSTLADNRLPTTTSHAHSEGEEEGREGLQGDCSPRPKPHNHPGLTDSKGRKKRKDYPSSWGYPIAQMKMKKRVLCTFDGPRRLWKDDMMLNTASESRLKIGDEKVYVTNLDVQTMRRADVFHNSTEKEKGPWIADDLTGMDLERLMETRVE